MAPQKHARQAPAEAKPAASGATQAGAQPRPSAPVVDSLAPDVAQDQQAGIPLKPPATPQAHAAPDVEPVQPTAAGAESVPLRAPPAPPASSAASSTARPLEPGQNAQATARIPARPAAPRKAESQPSQSPQGAYAQSPSPRTAPQPGTPPAPSASSQPADASAPAPSSPGAQGAAPTYGKLREVYARVGDDVQVSLDGVGFLFLGFPDRSPDGDGMSFKGKDTRDGKTWFSFKALKLGTYDLDFLKQDNATGTSSRDTVRVHVVSDADFASATAQQDQPQTPASGEAVGDPAFAARLASLGKYDAAIAELLKGYRDGNPALNDSIAQLYLRTSAYDWAKKYFLKNSAEQGQYGDSAVLGLARVAIAQNDQPALLSLLKRLLAVKDPGLEDTLLAAERFEREKNEVGLGIDLAGEYLSRYPDGKGRDEADFILGQLLEMDSQFRDLARARSTYQEILDRWPESPYAGPARDRIGYIDRHFFQIR